MFIVTRATVQAVGHQTLTTVAQVQSQASPCETHGGRIEIMTSSTGLHATMYNDAWQNLGLVWVVISTWLTASSYTQYFYSRPFKGMLHMLYKLRKKEYGVRCPTVFTVQGPMVMAHQADNTVLIERIVLTCITATRFKSKTKQHQTKSEKYPQHSYDIITEF